MKTGMNGNKPKKTMELIRMTRTPSKRKGCMCGWHSFRKGIIKLSPNMLWYIFNPDFFKTDEGEFLILKYLRYIKKNKRLEQRRYVNKIKDQSYKQI